MHVSSPHASVVDNYYLCSADLARPSLAHKQYTSWLPLGSGMSNDELSLTIRV